MSRAQRGADLTDIDFEQLAAELLRALRGGRSQNALARRLGYRSNVIYTWESARGFPTAAKTFFVARRVGVEPAQAITRFLRSSPPWVKECDPASRKGIVRLLEEVRGGASVRALCTRVSRDRFAVSRWLRGASEPRLPDFLRLIQACTLRVLDFVATLVSPLDLPSVSDMWRDLEATRAAAFDAPWSQGVLRALELEDYRQLPSHRDGWIADRLGISRTEETACLELLARSGQISFDEGRWKIRRILTVDARQDPATTRALREWWIGVALERLRAGAAGTFSYNVCAVSEEDYERIRALHQAFFANVQAIVAASQPVQRVLAVNTQIFALDAKR